MTKDLLYAVYMFMFHLVGIATDERKNWRISSILYNIHTLFLMLILLQGKAKD